MSPTRFVRLSAVLALPKIMAALEEYNKVMESCWGHIDCLPEGNPDAKRVWRMVIEALEDAKK